MKVLLKPKKKWGLAKLAILALLVLFFFYSLWLGVQLGRFKPFKPQQEGEGTESSGLSLELRRGLELEQEPVPPSEIVGVYHIHTRYSDGRSSPAKIARTAANLGLDFIILTDHGHPNIRSLESQGWKDGLLVLAGSELSVSRGHLVALDIIVPPRPFSQNAEQAAREIQAIGGFSVIAHPFSKVRWSWGSEVEFAGIEIIDTDTMFKKNFLPSLPYLPALLVKPRFYLLKTLERPAQALRKWDELNANHTFYGYFSADAHLLYRVLLTGFHLHVLLDAPLSRDFGQARAQVFGALREGRFYNAINAAGDARGFRFWAEIEDRFFPMGSLVPPPLGSGVRLGVHLPFGRAAVETHLIHDGRLLLRSMDEEIAITVKEPGTYRLEVYLRKSSPLARDVPWIVSNPIFIGKE